jgi:hypothetical protein
MPHIAKTNQAHFTSAKFMIKRTSFRFVVDALTYVDPTKRNPVASIYGSAKMMAARTLA